MDQKYNKYSVWELFIDVDNNEQSQQIKIKHLIPLIDWLQIQEITFHIREHFDIYKKKR